ncbi:recombination regulator RecX [Pseudalkalibacillus caeni]|uniref:recombination regulator RecX n=1 Tax=Exobacillus caeni TaxID=2574798 RepID=UPI00148557F1|nr:recombination regulator RecX [Pseudalkalibacillus caeni]
MTITRIERQKRNDERYNIFIEKKHNKGDEFGFSVDQDVLISYGLKKGMQIDSKLMEKIAFDDMVKKGLNQSLRFLSYRMRSQKEIIDYLKTKEISDNAIAMILDKLSSYGYTDDLEFGKTFVKSRMNASSKGPTVIAKELFEKGLDRKKIDKSLEEFDEETQLENARSFALKNAKKHKRSSSKEIRQKVSQNLASKGFSWEIIENVFDEVSLEKDEEEQWDAILYQGKKAHRKYKKYDGYEYKQRMKQYLYRKGFSISLIDRLLEEGREELND